MTGNRRREYPNRQGVIGSQGREGKDSVRGLQAVAWGRPRAVPLSGCVPPLDGECCCRRKMLSSGRADATRGEGCRTLSGPTDRPSPLVSLRSIGQASSTRAFNGPLMIDFKENLQHNRSDI